MTFTHLKEQMEKKSVSLLILRGFTDYTLTANWRMQRRLTAYKPPADLLPFTLQIEIYEIEWRVC